MPFRVIPAVDLKDGAVVRLLQGRKDRVTFRAGNPVEVAERWVEKGAKVLHVIDLDGAFEGRLRHEDIILEIAKLPVEVQVGGGIRSVGVAERLLKSGVDRVILGTIAFERVEEVRKLAERWGRRIIVAIDSRAGKVAVKGWTEKTSMTPVEAAKLYDDLDVYFLYTNVDVEGMVKGVRKENIREVVESLNNPVFIAGGISSVDDIRFVKRCGGAGVIIGSALYSGKLKFEEALKVEHEEVQQEVQQKNP